MVAGGNFTCAGTLGEGPIIPKTTGFLVEAYPPISAFMRVS